MDPDTYVFDYSKDNPTWKTFETAVGSTESEKTCVLKPAIHYWDSFDTSHKDEDFSVYRGQQPNDVLPHVQAACDLKAMIGNGGLVKVLNDDIVGAEKSLRNIRKKWKKKVSKAIKNAESFVKPLNKKRHRDAKKKGECYQGDIYSVVDQDKCKRQYTNTYVTNVNYQFILEKMSEAMQLTSYTAERKECPNGAPEDPIGQYEKNNRPTKIPARKSQAKYPMKPIEYCSDPRQNGEYEQLMWEKPC